MSNPTTGLPVQGVSSLPRFFDRYRGRLTQALKASLGGDTPGLYDSLQHHMGWVDTQGLPVAATEGKALRPTLCLFSSEAVGGIWQQAIPGAVALELIHNFSLVHDDIQDRDEERHHRPTLWSVWGEPKALVAGNTMRAVADYTAWGLLEEGHSERVALEVARLLTSAYLEMIKGQYLDMSFEGSVDIGVDDYLTMISLKTGALLRCSMHIGALMGTDDTDTIQAFSECGTALGQVFQIRDDLLGIWGKEELTGKPVGSDIVRRKKSFPVVYALNVASKSEKEVIHSAYAKKIVCEDDAAEVLNVMEQLNVMDSAQDMAEQRCQAALRALDSAELAPSAVADMEQLMNFLLTREY